MMMPFRTTQKPTILTFQNHDFSFSILHIQLFLSCSFSTPAKIKHCSIGHSHQILSGRLGKTVGFYKKLMATQVRAICCYHQSSAMAAATTTSASSLSTTSSNSLSPLLFNGSSFIRNRKISLERTLGFGLKTRVRRKNGREYGVVVASSNNVTTTLWDSLKPEKSSSDPSLSDILWPSAGAFAAMAILGKMDQMLAPKGISMTIAPLGAVCAVLFASPSSPAARKYNMFMAQTGCAAIGVVAFSIYGPGWLARSAALAASIAFMIYTRSTHPPAASLPILFIDGVKLHHLNFWYALFPGAAGCIVLSLIQEVVCYLKDSFKF